MGRVHLQGTGDMEDIEPPVPSGEGAHGREPLGLIKHISEIRGGDDQSALGDGSFKSGPILCGGPQRNSFSEL